MRIIQNFYTEISPSKRFLNLENSELRSVKEIFEYLVIQEMMVIIAARKLEKEQTHFLHRCRNSNLKK